MGARYPRAGLIRISDQLILESMVQILAGKDHVGLLFAGGIFPVEVRNSWGRFDYSEYMCISPHFPIVPAGAEIPLYDLSVHMADDRLAEIHVCGAEPPHLAIVKIEIRSWDIRTINCNPNEVIARPHDPKALADSLGISVEELQRQREKVTTPAPPVTDPADRLRATHTAEAPDPAPPDPDPSGGADKADEPG
jgi:hypothetical protein